MTVHSRPRALDVHSIIAYFCYLFFLLPLSGAGEADNSVEATAIQAKQQKW